MRRARFGPNVLPRPRRPGRLAIYLRQFRSPLIYLLLAAAVVSVVVGEASDAVFIFAVLQINAVIGAVQEWRAETSAEALNRLVHIGAVLRRDGVPCEADAADIVPGDIVRMESGARVPADLRLIEAHELRVDESLFTGESVPVDKTETRVLEDETSVADRCNMLHGGTVVTGGRGVGVATQTGPRTQVGRIAQALTATPSPPLPLLVRLARFTRLIGVATLVAVLALAVAEIARGTPPFEVFVIAIALVVSAIPEGLPVAITVALSVATARMARRGVMVRALPAVEGLGACTLIASDKTGTLTCNELTVKHLELPRFGAVEVGGEGYSPEGDLVWRGAPLADRGAVAEAVHRLAASIVLCNEASFRQADSGYVHLGDTVDVAFLVLGAKLGIEQTPLLDLYPRRGFLPFESERRFAVSVNEDGSGGLQAHVKGAAETVLPMCAGIDAGAVLAETDRLAAGGYRVLAVAAGMAPEGEHKIAPEDLRGLAFLGLVCLIDPVRPEVPDAIARCRQAGIAVSMITGDHPATALAIARELGMADDAADVVTGAELKALADDPPGLAAAIARGRVFARVDPVQKLEIVGAQRAAGHFAAVTG
ncbi:MAG: cation-translocating P-type ATPase, partial [Alphaproteobacteria bacterium]